MKGSELCDNLRAQLQCATDKELAEQVGLTPGRISQLRSRKKPLSSKYVARFLSNASFARTSSAFRSAIRPVVEFFPIDVIQVRENGRDLPFDPRENGGAELRARLSAAHGLYAFYNSQAEIIYFGKADKLTLYDEIINAFNRYLPHYELYNVKHPWGRFRSKNNDELRRIKKRKVTLSETAGYFSAYDVSPSLIGGLEALFIRLAPNDLINVRIEKKDMKAFPEPVA